MIINFRCASFIEMLTLAFEVNVIDTMKDFRTILSQFFYVFKEEIASLF
jgi:phosphorylcholine metabolism protein LicD